MRSLAIWLTAIILTFAAVEIVKVNVGVERPPVVASKQAPPPSPPVKFKESPSIPIPQPEPTVPVEPTESTAKIEVNVPELVVQAAQNQNVNVNFALKVAWKESRYKCDAISYKGARGAMQVMPGTARELGYKGPIKDLKDCWLSIHYGMKYLVKSLEKAGGNEALAYYYYVYGINAPLT